MLAARESRRHGPRPARDRWIGVAAGFLFSADLITWHHSIANVGAGLATVLGNLQVVLVAFAAWAVLGERPERRIIVAVPVVLTGAVMISGVRESGGYGRDSRGSLGAPARRHGRDPARDLPGDADVAAPAGARHDRSAPEVDVKVSSH